MTLDYIYHSGFAIEMEGVTVIIDYYKDSSETEHNRGIVHDYLLQRPGKLYVLATHFHPDHFNREILTWKEQRPDIQYILESPKTLLILKKEKPTKTTRSASTPSDRQISAVRSFFTYKIGVSSMPAT